MPDTTSSNEMIAGSRLEKVLRTGQFAVTGELSLRLYAAVFLFFGAGVFKVRVRTRKTIQYRWVMVLYCILAAAAFAVMAIPVIILLPFAENILSAIAMREECR